MLHLFMVIYLAGTVVGTVGPLPYGIDECRDRAAEMLAHGDSEAVTPRGYRLSDVKLECEFHTERPTVPDVE